MNVRDKFLTLKLEPALRLLVKNPALGLTYLSRRFNLGEDELRAWLDEFNGGAKTLINERIDGVKRELGAISEGKAAAVEERRMPPGRDNIPIEMHQQRVALREGRASPVPAKPAAAAPVIMHNAPEIAHKRITPAAPVPAPVPEKVVKPILTPTPAPAPAREEPGKSILTHARPWLGKHFRAPSFLKYKPVLLDLLTEGTKTTKACARHNVTANGLGLYTEDWLATTPTQLNPDQVREFIAWAEAKCVGYTSNPPRGKRQSVERPAPVGEANGKELLRGDAWDRWRSDAISALVTMGTKQRMAALQVDAAIAKLNGEDCEVGELVKLAMRETVALHATPAPAAGANKSPPPSDPCLDGLRVINRMLDTLLARARPRSRSAARSSGSSCSSGSRR